MAIPKPIPAKAGEVSPEVKVPSCARISARGIRTSADMKRFLAHVLDDIANDLLRDSQAAVIVKASNAIIRVAEAEQRYGINGNGSAPKPFEILRGDGEDEEAPDPSVQARAIAMAKLTPEERAALGLPG